MTNSSRRPMLIGLTRLVVVLALLVAACGDDDSGGASPSPTGTDSTPAPQVTSPGSGTTEAPISSASGAGTATVTIGDNTWQFDSSGPVASCNLDFFGGVQVAFSGPGLPGGFLLVLPGDDWAELGIDEPANAHVSITASDQEWFADPRQQERFEDLPPGSSEVGSWEVDGSTIRGQATFLERNSYLEALGDLSQVDIQDGTFEARCGG